MKVRQLKYRNAALCVVLSVIIAVALINRMYFLLYRGGFALDQLAWAMEHYFGGITEGYFRMADTIVGWTAEPRLWSYLPGYPAFLAILHLLGIEDPSLIRFVQIVIDSLAILPLYYVLLHVNRSSSFSLIGCLIYAAAPWWSVGSTYLLAESLLPALVILLLAALVAVREHSSRSAGWLLLGVFSAVLPFFRSEMVLLAVPLMVWALLVSPDHMRLRSVVFVVSGFLLPLLLWAVRNYYIHGQFMLTPPVKWYAAWSGLGQITNEFGYQANDWRAIELLKSRGIEYHSAAAERYWFGQYLNAWMEHPGYVIRTILRRFEMILGGQETLGTFTPRMVLSCYGAMAFITPVVLIRLLRTRRTADAFLIALPMLYALGSLGILYVERRYVRYAGLTYLLALPVLLKIISDTPLPKWLHRQQYFETRLSKVVVGNFILTILVVGIVLQILSMRDVAKGQAFANRLADSVSVPATSTLGDIKFRPALPVVEFSHGASDLELYARAPAGSYLLIAPIGSSVNAAAIVHYRVRFKKVGAIGLGILSSNGAQWLSHRTVEGRADEIVEGTLVSAVEVGSNLVVDAQDSSSETSVSFEGLEWAIVCPKGVNLLRVFFSKASIQPGVCSSSNSSPSTE